MIRRAFLGLQILVAIVVLAGCGVISSDTTMNDTDRIVLSRGAAAVEVHQDGQSAMLDGSCARRLGPTLQQMKERGASMRELRAELRSACQLTEQTAMNQKIGQPGRGRLFAPVRAGSGTRSGFGELYYYWFLRPLTYWSSAPSENVSWCQSFFWGWRGGDCFGLFYDFNNYSYYRPYCRRFCYSSIYTTQTTTTSSSSSSTSSSIAYDPCVANGCYGQWWWRF